jgi:preprotein translocase subunit SecB
MPKKSSLTRKQVSAVALGKSLLDAHLIMLVLKKCSANVVLRDRVPTELSQQIQVGGSGDPKSNRLHFEIAVSLTGGSEKDKTHSLSIRAEYQIVLQVADNLAIDEELHAEIGRRTGLNLVWPYWRELVNSLTSRMGVTPLVLPLLRQDSLTLESQQKLANTRTKKTAARRKTTT